MRLDFFYKMVEAMGCEAVVKDKMSTNKEWVVKIP